MKKIIDIITGPKIGHTILKNIHLKICLCDLAQLKLIIYKSAVNTVKGP